MANRDAPSGFVPLRDFLGGVVRANGGYTIASGYGTRIGRGDPVKMHSDGTLVRTAAGEVSCGVFEGCSYVDANGNQQFSPVWIASTVATNIEAQVYDSPYTVFGVQVDGGTLDQQAVGACADIVVEDFDLVTKTSQVQLSGTVGSSTAQCKILKKEPIPGNDWGANVRVEVLINEHFYKQEAGI